MIVISDTTAISNLIQINELELLKKLYKRILIPSAVFDELMILENSEPRIKAILHKDWIEIQTVKSSFLLTEIELSLDKGEAEAIALAIEIKADLLMIDEKEGRKVAEEKGVPIIGTMGVLLNAKQLGLISSVQEKMDELRQIGFWISDRFYNQVISLELNQ